MERGEQSAMAQGTGAPGAAAPARCLRREQDKYEEFREQQAALDARVSHDSLGADWPREHEQAGEVCRLSQADLLERIRIMMETEGNCLPRPDYIENVQKDGMRVVWRSKVASWLIEFEEEFGITQETIAVAVNYMDRYLSEISTKKCILQLLAMGAIFVATKLHETVPIGMHELRDLADGTYLESDIKLMELELLRVIQWKLTPVTPQSFMTHLIQFIPCPEARRLVHDEAVTFLDVAIPEYEFLRFTPSVVGTAAVLCAFETARVHVDMTRAWAASVACFGILDSPQVKECGMRMLDIFDNMMAPQQQQQQDEEEMRMQTSEEGPYLTPGVVGAETAKGSASAVPVCGDRAEQVVSPVGVEELSFSDSSHNARTWASRRFPFATPRGDEAPQGHDDDAEMYSAPYAQDAPRYPHKNGHASVPTFRGAGRPHDIEAMEADEGAPPGAVVMMDHDFKPPMRSKSDTDALQAHAHAFDFGSHDGFDGSQQQNYLPVPAPLCGAVDGQPLSHSCSVKSRASGAAPLLDLDPPARLQRSRSATR